MAEIVACGKADYMTSLAFQVYVWWKAEEIDHILASATDTVVLVTDGISCSTELISDLEEKYERSLCPLCLTQTGRRCELSEKVCGKSSGCKT